MNIFGGNSLWHLVMQSDAITCFILLLLLFLSIVCWTIFLCKYLISRIKQKQLEKILEQMKTKHTVEQVIELISLDKNTLPTYFLSNQLQFLKSLLLSHKDTSVLKQEVSTELFQIYTNQNIEQIVEEQHAYLSILSTSAAIAPLIGLFGTVWGLIHSFIRISERQAADITTVAPGIAEALMTTLAGLLVAIPALVMFNVLLGRTKKIEHQLNSLADSCTIIVYKLLAKEHYASFNSTSVATQAEQQSF